MARWWAEFKEPEPAELAFYQSAIVRFGEPALDRAAAERTSGSGCKKAMSTRRIFPIAAAIVLMAACSGAASSDLPRPASLASATSMAGAGTGSHVTSSTGRIVFDTFEDIWTVDADGTNLTRLTRSPWPEFDATWSPDGTHIAYRSERRDGDPEIWLMNADGSSRHRLARGLSPAWSPDGSEIAFASPGMIPCPPGRGPRCTGISIMDADGSGQRRVPHTDGGEYPSWSPDGQRIAFNSNLTGDHVMYIVNVDGSGLVDLSSVGEGWQVDWSPDGRSILFTSHRDHPDDYTDIYVMRPDGSDVERLTTNTGYTPAWSPDGREIVFSAPGLFVMQADGSGVTSLPLEGIGETSLPDWS